MDAPPPPPPLNLQTFLSQQACLYTLASRGYSAIVEDRLKQENLDVNQAEEDGTTPLYMASQNGH
eukprot:CAMPEP_0182496380 /NCGR_PEP_ID=MMETSP1321-20130603/5032_1 /TAXON_ID=91990 /ORGANISM="Bolidomonas sp., Strain RCC1657" /LENGTH=64 /DNA_ID=CAMNT_0024699983 /DNA_START=97 /DNA_END=288 /DNA_ORIENTATION=+